MPVPRNKETMAKSRLASLALDLLIDARSLLTWIPVSVAGIFRAVRAALMNLAGLSLMSPASCR